MKLAKFLAFFFLLSSLSTQRSALFAATGCGYPSSLDSWADKLEDGPAGASIVMFHGRPKPADLPANHWLREFWR